MSAYEQKRFTGRSGNYTKYCGLSGCHRPAKVREFVMGRPTALLCDPHAKAALDSVPSKHWDRLHAIPAELEAIRAELRKAKYSLEQMDDPGVPLSEVVRYAVEQHGLVWDDNEELEARARQAERAHMHAVQAAGRHRADAERLRNAALVLWEAATIHWEGPEELFDSSTALPGMPLKGKALHRIGVALGLTTDPEALTASPETHSAWPSSVHTCHSGCPCQTGGEPVPDFEAPNPKETPDA